MIAACFFPKEGDLIFLETPNLNPETFLEPLNSTSLGLLIGVVCSGEFEFEIF